MRALKDLVPNPDLLTRYNVENKERTFFDSILSTDLSGSIEGMFSSAILRVLGKP